MANLLQSSDMSLLGGKGRADCRAINKTHFLIKYTYHIIFAFSSKDLIEFFGSLAVLPISCSVLGERRMEEDYQRRH